MIIIIIKAIIARLYKFDKRNNPKKSFFVQMH